MLYASFRAFRIAEIIFENSMFLVNICNFFISELNAPRALPLPMEPTPVYALLRRSRSMARHISK